MTSIRDIPVDILYTIAQHLHASSPRDLVFVCKRWHDIVLSAPSLWTDIDITFPWAPPPADPTPERIAHAALRRAGPSTTISLHLEIHALSRTPDYATAVVDMIRARGYHLVRELTFGFTPSISLPLDRLSSLFSHLVGEWRALARLHFGSLPPLTWESTGIASFLDSVISTAPALHSLHIATNLLPSIQKKLSRKRRLVSLDVARLLLPNETLRFSLWPNITSLNIYPIGHNHPFFDNLLDLRPIDPPSSGDGDISAFPLLTHAVFTNHTLYFSFGLRLESLTDLALRGVNIQRMGIHSIEMPLLRNLSLVLTFGGDYIIAPRLETLSIGPLPERVNIAAYLSRLFNGHSRQLDPVHLDLRPIYKEQDSRIADMTVPLASVHLLRRVERISIAHLAGVHSEDRWKYRMLESVYEDDENPTKAMVMLPKWKEMDLASDDVPDWLWNIIIAREVAGFPVQLNLTNERE